MQYSSRKWQSSLLSLKGSSLWNNFQSGCIFHNMKSVCGGGGGGGQSHGWRQYNHKRWGSCSTVRNVSKLNWCKFSWVSKCEQNCAPKCLGTHTLKTKLNQTYLLLLSQQQTSECCHEINLHFTLSGVQNWIKCTKSWRRAAQHT